MGPLRILWASNAPWVGSGYGVQTAQAVRRIKAAGHDIAIASNYGLSGETRVWEGIPVYAGGLDAYGNDVLPALYHAWRAEGGNVPTALITLFDVWVYKNPDFDAIPISGWAPVDHYPVPPEVRNFVTKHKPIAMSRFGQRAFREAGVDAYYVPHAIETAIFRPTPSRVREALNVPADAFLVMINAANKGNVPPRKGWHEMLVAFASFARTHPDAYLYLHTDLDGHGGVALRVLLGSLGLTEDRVRVVPQIPYRLGQVSSAMLAELYSAADVKLSASYGEGFGVTDIEAQACGCPTIVTDFSAQSELSGAGWKVPYQPYWDLTQGSWFGQPLVASIASALEAAYAAKGDAALRQQAVDFAQQYDADRVFAEHWVPTLAAIEASLSRPIPKSGPNRAARRQGKRAKAA